MTDLAVIDTVAAYQIEAGDTIRVEGSDYNVLSVEDGDYITLTVEALDEADEKDEIALDSFTWVHLLAVDYSDVEV